MGVNAWNTFVLRAEHPYIARKSEKPLDMGKLTLHPEKTACYQIAAANQGAYFISFSMVNYSLELHKVHSIKAAAHGIRQFR